MDELIDQSADVATLTPFVRKHGRTFDLSILEVAIGRTLGEEVATAIGRHLESISYDTAITRWGAFRRYWEWFATSEQATQFRDVTKRTGV